MIYELKKTPENRQEQYWRLWWKEVLLISENQSVLLNLRASIRRNILSTSLIEDMLWAQHSQNLKLASAWKKDCFHLLKWG